MRYVLGVDGGNTKTIALIAAVDGTILGAGRSGCGDIYNATPRHSNEEPADAAVSNIEYAIQQAVGQAGVSVDDIEVAIFNMAGADWPEDAAFLREQMIMRGYGKNITVQNDALGILNACNDAEVGVSVICGTGAAIGARAPDGRVWHTSFWQEETQGAGHLAEKTLLAIYRAELGMDIATSLTSRVLDYYHLSHVEDVLHQFTYNHRYQPVNTEGLVPLLLDEAERGDKVAQSIVCEHGTSLGKFAQAAARKVGIDGTPFALVSSGGVFRHPSSLLLDAIIAQVRQSSPDVRSVRCRYEPAICVVLGAIEAAGQIIDDPLRLKIEQTAPPPELFMTISIVL
jgi:N-acetylglucosamine kinase-like BadF-type ATPase